MITNSIKLIFIFSGVILMLNTFLWVYNFKKELKFSPDFNLSFKNDIFPFFSYIFPAFLGVIINFFNYRFDVWVVSYFKGNVQLGLYALAVNLGQFILLFSKIIAGVITPYLSEDDAEKRRRYFTLYSRINFTTVLLMGLTLFALGNFIITFLYGKEFEGSVLPLKLLLLGMVFTAMSQIFSVMFFSMGKNKITLLATSIGLIFTIAFDFLLIPKYDIEGAAIATTISYFSIFITLMIYLVFKEGIKLKELFILRKTDIKDALKLR